MYFIARRYSRSHHTRAEDPTISSRPRTICPVRKFRLTTLQIFVTPVLSQSLDFKMETLDDFLNTIGVSTYKAAILEQVAASLQLIQSPPGGRHAISPPLVEEPGSQAQKWNSTTPQIRCTFSVSSFARLTCVRSTHLCSVKPGGRTPVLTRSLTHVPRQQPPLTLDDLTVDVMEELYLPAHVQNFIWRCRNEVIIFMEQAKYV